MDWRSRLETAKTTVKAAQGKGAELAGDAIEQYWPAIQQALREHVAPTVTGAVSSDDLVMFAARTLHGYLPLPIRLVIRPQRLTNWCLNNRDRVLAAIQSLENRSATAPAVTSEPASIPPPEVPPGSASHQNGAPANNATGTAPCAKCGHTNRAGAKFCTRCGVRIPPAVSSPDRSAKLVGAGR